MNINLELNNLENKKRGLNRKFSKIEVCNYKLINKKSNYFLLKQINIFKKKY